MTTGELLTPSAVTGLLADHGLAPRRRDGQNFLVDPNTVRAIVAAAAIGPDDDVMEFGPGVGSLTLGLAAAARRVTAIELDRGLVGVLAEVLAGCDNVEVIHGDALAVDLEGLLAGRSVRLVANLPYNVATPLLFTALERPEVRDAYVMVQREVGERWQAQVGDRLYAAVSLKLQLLAEVRLDRTIPRTVFHPVPNVDSVMVRVRRRPDAPDPVRYRKLAAVADLAFRARRKTLRNTLRGLAGPEELEAAATRAGIDLGARAEQLTASRLTALVDELGRP